jgi:2'-5' RNA ligase
VLTLELEADAFARFQGLRELHFPPERNIVPAHVSLFHHLPGRELETVEAAVKDVCGRTQPVRIRVIGLRFLGRGVAYELESAELKQLHAHLAEAFAVWLTSQDRQAFRPHITVQNKVESSVARALRAELQAGFEPFEFLGTGVLVWHYRGGPWELAQRVALSGRS